MSENYKIHKQIFEHHLIEGSHYEIGKKQGVIMKKYDAAVKMYTSGSFDSKKSKFKNFQEVYDFYDSYCPGLREEAQGFADALKVSVEKLFIFDFPASVDWWCCHLVAPSTITKKNEILVGRSYEWDFRNEDLQLRTTKVNGKYRHLGFSGMVFGRYDGMNEKGLCITYSAAGAWNAPIHKKGLNWAHAVRVMLDNCKDANDALNTFEQIPIDWSSNFILTDRSGTIFLIESMDAESEVKELDKDSEENYVLATNHFTLPSKVEYNKFNNPWLLPNSQKRYEIISSHLDKNKGKINEDSMKKLLGSEFPEGICCHWHTDCFGTVWSMLFNVTEGKTLISFGPPTHNKWYEFFIQDEVTTNEYEATFVDKRIESA